MNTELRLLFETIVFAGVWVYLDHRLCIWAGMSPIFGALKQDNPSQKVRDFSFSIGITILICSFLDFFIRKITGHIPIVFVTFKFFLYVITTIVIFTLLSRVIISFIVRKDDNGESLTINGIIAGVFLLVGIFVILYGFVL